MEGRAPTPIPKPYCVEFAHGARLEDEFYWLRDDSRTNPEVLAYLDEEANYFDHIVENRTRISEIQAQFVEQLQAWIEHSPQTFAPWEQGDYYYYKKLIRPTDEGPSYFRKQKHGEVEEQLLLDRSTVSGDIGFFEVSPCQRYLAYGIESAKGSECYTMFLKDLESDSYIDEPISGTGATDTFCTAKWSNASEFLYYIVLDSHMCPKTVKRHRLHTPISSDEILYAEHRPDFVLSLNTTNNHEYLLLFSHSQTSAQVWYVPLCASPTPSPLRPLLPCNAAVEYAVDSHGSYFYIATNANGAYNFELFRVPVDRVADRSQWELVVPHRDDIMLVSVEAYRDFLVVYEVCNCDRRVRIFNLSTDDNGVDRIVDEHYVHFPLSVYSLFPGNLYDNHTYPYRDRAHNNYEGHVITFTVSSFVVPTTVMHYDMVARKFIGEWRKRELPKGFDPSRFTVKRLYAPSSDGKPENAIPISGIFHNVDSTLRKARPTLLYVYGAYGAVQEARYSLVLLALLERGFNYATLHVRGGAEKGRRWYDEGRLMNKLNTFRDVADSIQYLCSEGYTSPEMVGLWGRSAGGLSVCASAVLRPELVRAVIADVPFVDVCVSMGDPTVPWMAFELSEWGDAHDPVMFEYMKSYCPIRNVRPGVAYPHFLLSCGLNDSKVQYWEPAKFVAALRKASQTCDQGEQQLVLFKVNKDAGHFLPASELENAKEMALRWAFLVYTLGRK